MIDFEVETEIGRPPAEVFAYVADPAKLPTWQTSTVSATPEPNGPLRLGSRIREVHSAPVGKPTTSLVEVAEYEPTRVLGLRVIEGPPIHGRITLEPAGQGTRLRFKVYGQPRGAMRLAEPILKPALKRQFTGYCARLKQLLEEGAPAAHAATS